ncbi:acetoacetate metabolism regulatory protein AtoC [Sorangium cellulosum So0157-2]|uniref:Acetoacetate metabolism regulatory protein AtoC n=2 Tax=Sorangium cellulosum TaxID=56 RepID=S4XJV2_SORCE|nr:acetoacetate metabolism regulatory protein AtoC [Sorangium cellulosum So0157-2]
MESGEGRYMQSSEPVRDDAGTTWTLEAGVPSALQQSAALRIALMWRHAGKIETRLLSPDTPLVVGRSAPAALWIDDRTLSREHARFVLSGGRVWVDDLGSKNGTFLDGRRVSRARIAVGDEIVLGNVALRVQALGAGGESLDLEGEERLLRRVEDELTRARHFRRPFALLHVRIGAAATAEGWIKLVRACLQPVHRVALYGTGAAQVFLPETGAEEANRIAQAIAASSIGGDARLLVGCIVYPDAGSSANELFAAAREAARRASPERPVAHGPSAAAATVLAGEDPAVGGLIAGQRMRALLEAVKRVAASRIPVVLHGETGTGKEVLARMIHESGPRKGMRMVRVNCGAIPKDLVESTLFGHERGAFTGALQQQKGVFEEADGGTVFLDEIGELPPAAQAALLRVLEVGAFSRVGSSREIEVDVRVVAATHRDLEAMAASGAFREDLFYRLSGVVVDIPPLRERRDEIEPLARHFLRAAGEANGRDVDGVAPEALALLGAYAWPGNVRELRNVIERAVVVARGAIIEPEDLPPRVRAAERAAEPERVPNAGRASEPGGLSTLLDSRSRSSAPPAPEEAPAEAGRPARGKVQQYEAKLLHDTLEAAGWSRAEAARRLGMPVRTLSYRMKVLGVKRPSC